MTVTPTLQDRQAEVLLGAIQPLVAALPSKAAPLRAAFVKLYDATTTQAKPYVVNERRTRPTAAQHSP